MSVAHVAMFVEGLDGNEKRHGEEIFK